MAILVVRSGSKGRFARVLGAPPSESKLLSSIYAAGHSALV